MLKIGANGSTICASRSPTIKENYFSQPCAWWACREECVLQLSNCIAKERNCWHFTIIYRLLWYSLLAKFHCVFAHCKTYFSVILWMAKLCLHLSRAFRLEMTCACSVFFYWLSQWLGFVIFSRENIYIYIYIHLYILTKTEAYCNLNNSLYNKKKIIATYKMYMIST